MKQLVILAFTLMSFHSQAQTEHFLISLEIQKIFYHGDSLVFENPKKIEIKTGKVTDIIEIGKIGTTSFGVEFEILESELGDEKKYIAGKTYYYKSGTYEWAEIVSYSHSKITIEEPSKQQQKKKLREDLLKKNPNNDGLRKAFLMGNSDTVGDPVKFGIYYNVSYSKYSGGDVTQMIEVPDHEPKSN